eukprot:1186316-Prorocentrum_minimum.AAC.1
MPGSVVLKAAIDLLFDPSHALELDTALFEGAVLLSCGDVPEAVVAAVGGRCRRRRMHFVQAAAERSTRDADIQQTLDDRWQHAIYIYNLASYYYNPTLEHFVPATTGARQPLARSRVVQFSYGCYFRSFALRYGVTSHTVITR